MEKLDGSVKAVFKKALKKRLEQPKIEAQKLSAGLKGCYKIKLRNIPYRLVYKVYDKEVVVLVLAVGKREKSRVYNQAVARKSSVVETFASDASSGR